MRNSSLVAVARRREFPGLSGSPIRRLRRSAAGGRGASPGGRSGRGSARGPPGSANAGMSSVKAGENPARRKPQGSGGRIVRSGLVGPKARPHGVVDGQSVEIPILAAIGERTRTRGGCGAGDWKGPSNAGTPRGGTPGGRRGPGRAGDGAIGRPAPPPRKVAPGDRRHPYSNHHWSVRRQASGARVTAR